ncbi:MAG TPA: hypothetical protein PLV87_00520 [Opitutaceae bacterium]|nr:hypothetical protein [Opitutaceae bacterium]
MPGWIAILADEMSDACKKTPSPVIPPGSMGPTSSIQPNTQLFKTITSDDWKRSLASARQRRALASERIRTTISSSSPPMN